MVYTQCCCGLLHIYIFVAIISFTESLHGFHSPTLFRCMQLYRMLTRRYSDFTRTTLVQDTVYFPFDMSLKSNFIFDLINLIHNMVATRPAKPGNVLGFYFVLEIS